MGNTYLASRRPPISLYQPKAMIAPAPSNKTPGRNPLAGRFRCPSRTSAYCILKWAPAASIKFHGARAVTAWNMEERRKTSPCPLCKKEHDFRKNAVAWPPRTLYWTGSYPPLGGISCAIVKVISSRGFGSLSMGRRSVESEMLARGALVAVIARSLTSRSRIENARRLGGLGKRMPLRHSLPGSVMTTAYRDKKRRSGQHKYRKKSVFGFLNVDDMSLLFLFLFFAHSTLSSILRKSRNHQSTSAHPNHHRRNKHKPQHPPLRTSFSHAFLK